MFCIVSLCHIVNFEITAGVNIKLNKNLHMTPIQYIYFNTKSLTQELSKTGV